MSIGIFYGAWMNVMQNMIYGYLLYTLRDISIISTFASEEMNAVRLRFIWDFKLRSSRGSAAHFTAIFQSQQLYFLPFAVCVRFNAAQQTVQKSNRLLTLYTLQLLHTQLPSIATGGLSLARFYRSFISSSPSSLLVSISTYKMGSVLISSSIPPSSLRSSFRLELLCVYIFMTFADSRAPLSLNRIPVFLPIYPSRCSFSSLFFCYMRSLRHRQHHRKTTERVRFSARESSMRWKLESVENSTS